jgi:predicted MPP superfamily phosphohydrolase
MSDLRQIVPAAQGIKNLRLAVVSDLHAFDTLLEADRGIAPSHLCTNDPEDLLMRHPLAGLISLARGGVSADVLVCCGDMADKARPVGTRYVWAKLQELREALGARLLAVAPGNHDVDSRHNYNDHDAKGVLQSLVPAFPFSDETLNDKFWARNYAIHTDPAFRLLLLNTAAYHGEAADEYKHGRLSTRTADRIRAELDVVTDSHPRAVNILVCHHHPLKFGDIEDTDYSEMRGGHALLDLLGSGKYGQWLILHGHKHHPRIQYAPGGAHSPIIFSAGSLSASLHRVLQTQTRNQFYVITIPLPPPQRANLSLAGTFRTWEWILGHGWRPASLGTGLPAQGGFGFRGSLTHLSASVHDHWLASGSAWLEWTVVAAALPDLNYLLPGDLEIVLSQLTTAHSLRVHRETTGHPAQIGRAS